MKTNVKSAFPTMLTPYNKDMSVDYGAVRALVDWYSEKGCDGIFAVCQSSEIFFLSLNDRIKLASVVCDEASKLSKSTGKRMTVVASGHISYDRDDQISELHAISESGIDSLILISNRMDIPNTTEDKWISDTLSLADAVKSSVPLGMYECPTPYKRVLTLKMLKALVSDGRFNYMKDTCCSPEMLTERSKLTANTDFRLLNANAQTLLHSLRAGADGYCGIMCNFHPELYAWLCHNFDIQPELAEKVQAFLSMSAFTEQLSYPLTAKYHLKELEGLPFESLFARNRKSTELDEYNKLCMRQMKMLADEIYSKIK